MATDSPATVNRRASSPVADEQAALAGAGVPAGVLPVGSILPNASLLDPHGRAVELSEFLGADRSVIVFYRGAWCPHCNRALRRYEAELLPELHARGVPLVAINPQAPDGSLSMQENNELTFVVLSDPGNKLAQAVASSPAHPTRSGPASSPPGSTSPPRTPTARPACRCRPCSSSTTIASSVGSMSTRTMRPGTEPAEILAALDMLTG